MDRLERRLKEDAERIPADVGPQLRERIRASLEAIPPVESMPRRTDRPGFSLWLTSSLAGLAGALLVIAIVNWDRGAEPGAETASEPQTMWPIQGGASLTTETAEWTAPLEDELEKLKSDLEKAKENVERDLRLSL